MAQEVSGMRRIGVLLQSLDGPGQQQLAALVSTLTALGWVRERTIHFDVRWSDGTVAQTRAGAKELVDLKPDVIVATPSSLAAAVLRETKTIPVVFAYTTDPVGLGFVQSLAHPGGNATGFTALVLSFYAKWLEALKELAPNVTRVLAIASPDPGSGARKSLPVLRSTAQALKMSLVARFPRNQTELLDAIAAFAREPGGGLLQLPDAVVLPYQDQEIAAAARYRLPAIYSQRNALTSGGLMFYGADQLDEMQGVASYVDHILRGANPGDLPVQNRNKYILGINLKTAKALGLTVPQSVLLRADEVIR